MYTLIRLLPAKQLLSEQAPALALAWLATELLYKFHSFTLECVGFLATWFVLDAVAQTWMRAAGKPQKQSSR